VARDRIERVLQTFCCSEKETRPTVDVASHRWRIPAYAEDIDGQVEGLFANFFMCGLLTGCVFPTRQMIGGLCHVRFLVLVFAFAMKPGCRNDGGASREYSPRDLAECFGDGIFRYFPGT
jgi:hypothetical protein